MPLPGKKIQFFFKNLINFCLWLDLDFSKKSLCGLSTIFLLEKIILIIE